MNKIKLFNIPIDNISYEQTVKKIDDFIISKKPHQIITINPEIIMNGKKDKNYFSILNNSDLNVPDGAGLFWAAKYTNQNLNNRVTGVDLIEKICHLAQEKNYSIFFLGGQNKVGEKAAEKLKEKFPKLKVAGIFEGFPDLKTVISENDQTIINNIKKAKPDILLVAYGAPKQEQFINLYKSKLNIPVMIGIGGSFDYISGSIKRAPKWMRTIHLEWLYRVFKQPSRLNRIITATIRFPLAVIFDNKVDKS